MTNQTTSIVEGTTLTGIFWRRTFCKETHDLLVLIMGYGGSLRTWPGSFIERLSRNFVVVTYDNRGTGKSIVPKAPEDYTVEAMSSDLDQIVNELNIGRFHLLGYSMGGCMAIDYTHRHQERIKTLTLLSSTAGGALYAKPDPAVSAALASPKGDTLWDLYVSTFDLMYSPAHFQHCLPVLEEIYKNSKDWATSPLGLRGHSHAFKSFDSSKYIEQITIPTLLVSGVQDRLMPVQNSKNLASALPNSRLVLLDDCEHAPHIQEEERIVAGICEHCVLQD